MKNATLIIPFYNGSRYLERALISATNQKLQFDEIIVVDDGSKDLESGFLKDLLNKYKFTLIRKTNGGQGSARNEGVRKAKSEYVCFLDQDDVLYPEHHQILLEKIRTQREPKGWVYGDFATINENDCVNEVGWVGRITENPKRSFYQMMSRDAFILPSASIISKKAFLSVGGFDGQFKGYEDDDLFIRLFRAGYWNEYVDAPVYLWRSHGEQTSSSTKMAVSRLNFIKKWIDISRNIENIYVDVVKLLFDRFFKTVLIEYAFSDNKNKLFYEAAFNEFLMIFQALPLNGARRYLVKIILIFMRFPDILKKLLLNRFVFYILKGVWRRLV